MIYILINLLITFFLIIFILKEKQQTIIKHKDLIESECIIDASLENNKFIIFITSDQEIRTLIVYSKNWINYQKGDKSKIIEYSDGLYFIL